MSVTSVNVAKRACEAGGFSIERQGEFAQARVNQRTETCPDCAGTGLLRNKIEENGRTYDVATPCPRRRMANRAELFNAAHLPAVHAAATFEAYRPSNAEQARALSLTKDFAMRWPGASGASQPLRGYMLSGPVGTGKTHLLAATLKHLVLELGVRAGYIEISLLYAAIRRGFQDGKSGGEIIGPLSALDVLAIDELGKGRGSVFELETLDELIARRYNSGKVTLFATNFSLRPSEERAQRGLITTELLVDQGKESKLLCERVGDRIYSRLCEMCEFVEFPSNTTDARRAKVAADQARRRT